MDFVIKSDTCFCFFCLKSNNLNLKPEIALISQLCRYLKIRVSPVLEAELRKMSCNFCEKCKKIMVKLVEIIQFSEAIKIKMKIDKFELEEGCEEELSSQFLELLEMELSYYLGLIKDIIWDANNGKADEFIMKADANKLREQILQACKQKAGSHQPRVILKRLTKTEINNWISPSASETDEKVFNSSIIKCEPLDLENPSIPIPLGFVKQEILEDIKFSCESTVVKKNVKHLRKNQKSTKTKTCEICDKKFNEGAYYNHMYRLHNPNYKKKEFYIKGSKSLCKICRKHFDREIINEHRQSCKSHVDPDHYKYICKICKNGFETKQALNSHLMFVHTSKKHECDVCHLRFKKNVLLKNHKAEVHQGQKFYCQVEGCQKAYKRRRYTLAHQRHAHPDFKSGQVIKNERNSKKFTRIIVKGEEIIKCNFCGAHSQSEFGFGFHYKSVHAKER